MGASATEPRPLVRDVLLRDGSTLRLQVPTSADFADIQAFYDRLSEVSRSFRFHGLARTDLVAREEAEAMGLDRMVLISRHDGQVSAVASYAGLREPGVAEVSFAVADDDQGRWIGMRMLEQLAEIAADHGIHRFDAEVMANNAAMLAVLEHAGYAVRRRGSFGEVAVSLDITPTAAVLERIDERGHVAAVASLRPVLAPSSVAVVGAAATPGNVGRAVLANIIRGGFQGVAMPVNRAGGVVCSLRAAPSLGELQVAPELVIISVAGDAVLEYAAEGMAEGARALLVLAAGREQRSRTPGSRRRSSGASRRALTHLPRTRRSGAEPRTRTISVPGAPTIHPRRALIRHSTPAGPGYGPTVGRVDRTKGCAFKRAEERSPTCPPCRTAT